ncbi:MAG: hypothetical protein ACKVPJ_09645 [Chitinophagales bacterium]
MNKILFIFTITVSLATATFFISCQTVEQKAADANEKVEDAKKDANALALETANAAEWKIFKSESELKIKENEKRIGELKIQMAKPGKILDPIYTKRINTMEQQNKDLEARMEAYAKNQSDWETFKREFNYDINELGLAIEAFSVDNKK